MTEKELLTHYRTTGDLEVLGRLYSPYMSLLFGVCYKYLQDTAKSQDAVMSIFEELIEKLRIHEVDNFKGWLYVLARNHCLMELRKAKRTQQVDIEDHMFESESVLKLSEDPKVHEEIWTELNDCIKQLNEQQQKAITLFFLQKKCYQDIVEETGYDLKKVKSYIQNGKRNLKICLESKGVKYGK